MSGKSEARKLFTTGQVARFCQVSVPTVFNWIKANKLQAYTTAGGQYRVKDIALVAFMREHGMYVPPELERTVSHTVLVVDDDAMIRTMVSKVLEKIPEMTIETAADGVEACIKIGKMQPDVLFLDISMPNMDGWEVIQTMKGDTSLHHTKVIVMSGYWNPDENQAETSFEYAYLAKPFTEQDLLAKVNEVLDLGISAGIVSSFGPPSKLDS